MTTAPHVPAPPPGPGVLPPFPAPPVEGKGKRVGMGLAVAAGVLVLVCGGGGAALIGLVTSMSSAMQERAGVAVRGYLDAIVAGQYDKAYGMLCDEARKEESAAEFRTRIAGEERITDYTVGDLDLVTVTIPVDATYDDGSTAKLEAELGQDRDTGDFEVCRLAG